VASLGARLARFHADARPDVRDDGAGAVKRPLDDNFATLRSLIRDPGERAALARAERFASAFLTRAWNELDDRATAGLVRDEHGDLRLEHVLLEREIEVIDCVEFDPRQSRSTRSHLAIMCQCAPTSPSNGYSPPSPMRWIAASSTRSPPP
jgi:aminoglycoside phosphotransferase family enzyme